MHIEEMLSEHGINTAGQLRINLSNCISIDSAALLYLVAVTAYRKEFGTNTRFVLPRDPSAQHYLRQRDFPSAIENVAEIPFRLLVDDYWFDEPDPLELPRLTGADAAILAYLNDRRFFSFSYYDVHDRDDRAPIIEREGSRWTNPLVVELLRGQLRARDAEEVSRVIIREMLTTLLNRDPAGDVMCVSSVDRAGVSQSPTATLTIAAWCGPSIGSEKAVDVFEHLIELIDRPEFAGLFSITPSKQSAATSATPRANATPSAADAAGRRWLAPDGLESLYRQVVDKFDGHLDLCAGSVFAALTKSDDEETPYHLDYRRRETLTGTGSIIAVRLPLRHA